MFNIQPLIKKKLETGEFYDVYFMTMRIQLLVTILQETKIR